MRLRRTPPPLRVDAPPALLELAREGALALSGERPGERLRIACVVPPFRRGSGGHATIVHLLRALEERGHVCSVWIDGAGEPEDFGRFFGVPGGGVHRGFAGWRGADVALATGWQTVPRVLRLGGAAARAYLVQDHEPDFFGASAERVWAEQTYRLGLPCIAASPWLAGLLRERYGARAHAFDLGVDHDVYRPADGVARGEDVVAFYARAATPRRAVPLGVLALRELLARRPRTEVVLFGEPRPLVAAGFAHRDAGVLPGPRLARLYAEATVGLVLSLTNPSLVPTEMLACGLPVVDVASDAMRATFGDDGPVALAEPDPVALATTLARLLDDPAERERRAAAGLALARERTWARAAEQVEAALRAAVG
jgi:glycosyltransferase involved in cell wall biosynthesis